MGNAIGFRTTASRSSCSWKKMKMQMMLVMVMAMCTCIILKRLRAPFLGVVGQMFNVRLLAENF